MKNKEWKEKKENEPKYLTHRSSIEFVSSELVEYTKRFELLVYNNISLIYFE